MYTLQDQKVIPEKKKYVLDAHIGYTNSLKMYSNEIQKIINETSDILLHHLHPIFGKWALHNLIIYDHHISKFTTNVFTHDGINSILNLEFMSPIQKYLANNIAYIGQHVDRVAHDGTTTAMLFSTLLFKKLYNKLITYYNDLSADPDEQSETFKITVTNVSNILQETMDTFIKYTRQLTIKPFTKQQLEQLLTITTKGNKKLAKYISDIFIDVPPEALEIFKYGRSNIETEEDFKIIETKEDYWIMQNGFPSVLFNDPLGTCYTKNNIYVLIYPGTFEGCPDYHKDTISYIFEKFHTLYPDGTLLFIPLSINPVTIEKTIRTKYPYVIAAKYSSANSYLLNNPLELKILLSLTDTPNMITHIKSPKDAKEFRKHCDIEGTQLNKFLFKCNVEINSYGIKFYNLYETNHYIHKFYYDETKTEYHNLLKAIKDKLEKTKKQFNIEDTRTQYETYQLLYRNMISYKLPFIQVGGKTQDVASRMDLIEDAKGSATVALQHGIIKNPFLLFTILASYVSRHPKNWTYEYVYEYDIVMQSILDTFITLLIYHISMITHNNVKDEHIRKCITTYTKNKTDLESSLSTIQKMLQDISLDKLLSKDVITEHEINIQPIYNLSILYTELFNRIKEVIPKLLSTYNIIVPDTVVVTKKSEKVKEVNT